MEDVETLGGVESVRAETKRDGRFRGLAEENPRRLQVTGEFGLRLNSGYVDLAALPNGRDVAYLHGLGDPPF